LSRLFKASIRENIQLTKNNFLITLHPLEKIVNPKPGQFFMLSAYRGVDPLLRRPFSLHRRLGRDFQILYRVLGKLTHILKDKKPADIVEIMGPLGNGFPATKIKNKPVLVAGGLGVAPLFALAEKIADKNPVFFLGAKNKEEALCIDELKSIGINAVVSTDNGTLGQKGLITDVLRDFLSRHSSLVTRHCLFACGPKPMLKNLSLLTEQMKLKGYIALEENMACGMGACLGCMVNTRKGFKRVCKEGPVFPMEEIIW